MSTVRYLLLLAALASVGCLNLEEPGPLNGAYHNDFTFLPGPERTQAALLKAAADPWTWRPLVAGVLLDASQFDEELSERARTDQPVFGSERAAHAAGRDLLTALRVVSLAATISSEGADEVLSWSGEKNEDLGGHILATGSTLLAIEGLGGLLPRSSPNDESNRSFPSSTAGEAFSHATWTRRGLEGSELPPGYTGAASVGANVLAFGSSWARIEAGEQHLMDVLAGMAVANFATVFVNEAFLGEWQQREIRLAVSAVDEDLVLGVNWGF